MCLVLGQESSQPAWNLGELHSIMKLKNLTMFPDTAVCATPQLCCSLQKRDYMCCNDEQATESPF